MSGPAAGASARLARALAPHLVTAGAERPIVVDQTNRSVVVDEAVIVKWFRPPQPMPHHGSETLAHLAEVGFDAMPAFHGTHTEDGVVVASVAEFVAGARDGWEWYLDEVHAWIDGTLDRAVLERRALALGTLAGGLHAALATPSSGRPEPVTSVPVRSQFERMAALLDEARAVTTGITAEHLAGRWRRIGEAIAMPDDLDRDATTPAIAIHGDLHVGNVIDDGGRLVVIDFDGNPMAGTEVRPPAVDVASLLQSIDHIGRIVDHRTGGARRADLTAFIDDSVALALDAYRAELAAASLPDLLDERLLRPLRIAQELHELVYAAAHLPHWVYVPDAALIALFPDEELRPPT